MGVVPLPSCLLGLGNFSPTLTAVWEVRMHHVAASVLIYSSCDSCPSGGERSGDATKANWKHKGRTRAFSPPPSFPAYTRARRGEGKRTLMAVADAASRSPQEAQLNGGLVPRWRREETAGGLHGQGSKKEARSRTDGGRDKMITGGDSRISVTLKAQIPFVICKTNSIFMTLSPPHTYCRLHRLVHCAGREELAHWWRAGEKL